ncbi:CheR family methyltransferase [Qipengyuania huizhouensis]|uniref:CheR family methyltransferase n=1 Tax=Qipengyuania huizhouensis TaxID=2867245 RepID=UPI001C883265|nr:chemotaxis protein CheB [Qipengyuania huizhouensis]MBX7459716.1 PAS domain-containing protein [Qipengyuania huizhouensis]
MQGDDYPSKNVPLVGIGASAGGLEAVRQVFDGIQQTGLCFVVVMHLDPNHQSMMAELIARGTGLDVQQARDGDELEPDKVFVIPPGHGILVKDGALALTEFSEPRGIRRPIDDFFTSMASDCGANSACIILSGTGADGSMGMRDVKEHGGLCIAQDPSTARYDGMPVSAARTGMVDHVLKPEEMVERTRRFFQHNVERGEAIRASDAIEGNLEAICEHLADVVGHDFSGYKATMLARRIQRRMQVLNIGSGEKYLDRLRSDEGECEALFRDLLINVTRFFRDPDAFEELRSRVLEPMVSQASPDEAIRVWVPGCSTGEEAYTLAIMFASAAEKLGKRVHVQIFATDIDDDALAIAREAVYPAGTLEDIPEEYRPWFSEAHDRMIGVAPSIRDMVRFSHHSLIRDPSFSRLDLISCRNLLIYMDDRSQASLVPLFHFALKPSGFLFLGPSESIGRHDDLFVPVDQRMRLFRKRDNSVSRMVPMPISSRALDRGRMRQRKPSKPGQPSQGNFEEAERRILDRFAPPHIIVDQGGYLKSASGRLGRYLEVGKDDGPTQVSSLVRRGLKAPIARGMREAGSKGRTVAQRDVTVKSEFGSQKFDLVIDPLNDGTFLIAFLDTERFRQADMDDDFAYLEPRDDVAELEDELQTMRFRLRSTVEELETVNEELKSSNEEMMSMNEELQSTNEELTTVNDELKVKIDQLATANDDLRNYLHVAELGILVLDEEFRIRQFTDRVMHLFALRSSDRGRRLEEIENRIPDQLIMQDTKAAVANGEVVERTLNMDDDGNTLQFSVRPYRREDGTTAGAILTFTDVSAISRAKADLTRQSQRLGMALGLGGIGVWNRDTQTGLVEADEKTRAILGLGNTAVKALEDLFSAVSGHKADEIAADIRQTLENGEDFHGEYPIAGWDSKAERWVGVIVRRITISDDKQTSLGLVSDITDERSQKLAKDLFIREMNHRVKNLFAVIGSMIGLIARNVDDVPTLVAITRDRIEGLARAHSATQGEKAHDWLDLAELVENVVGGVAGQQAERVTLPETTVILPGGMATSFGLIFHELATNAAKYGVLSGRGGTIKIDWEVVSAESGKRNLRISWIERLDDPIAIDPSLERSGFGTRLIDTTIRQLEGKAERNLSPSGLEIWLNIPVSQTTETIAISR